MPGLISTILIKWNVLIVGSMICQGTMFVNGTLFRHPKEQICQQFTLQIQNRVNLNYARGREDIIQCWKVEGTPKNLRRPYSNKISNSGYQTAWAFPQTSSDDISWNRDHILESCVGQTNLKNQPRLNRLWIFSGLTVASFTIFPMSPSRLSYYFPPKNSGPVYHWEPSEW